MGSRPPDLSRLRRRTQPRATLLSLGRDGRPRVRARSRARRAPALTDRRRRRFARRQRAAQVPRRAGRVPPADECAAPRRSRFRSTWRKARGTSRPDSRASTIATSCARCATKARAKLLAYPGLFDAGRLERRSIDLRVRRRGDGARARVRGCARLLRAVELAALASADSATDVSPERGGRSVSAASRARRGSSRRSRQSGVDSRVHGARRPRRIRGWALAVVGLVLGEWRACEFLANSLRSTAFAKAARYAFTFTFDPTAALDAAWQSDTGRMTVLYLASFIGGLLSGRAHHDAWRRATARGSPDGRSFVSALAARHRGLHDAVRGCGLSHDPRWRRPVGRGAPGGPARRRGSDHCCTTG